MLKDENKLCVYAMKNDRDCNALILDFYDLEYEIDYNIDKRSLKDKDNRNLKKFRVEKDLFKHLCTMAETNFDRGEIYHERKTYEELCEDERKKTEEERSKPRIDKNTISKAIRLELNKDEIARIATYDVSYEKSDYYDFKAIEAVIEKYLSFEIDDELFRAWCWICMRVFLSECKVKSPVIGKLYEEIGDTFDCWLFDIGRGKEELKMCYDRISYLRYVDHMIRNRKQGKQTDYERNGIIIYSTYEIWIGKVTIYKTFIVDKNRKKANLKYSYDPQYKDLYITHSSERDFNNALTRFFDKYEFDDSLNEYDQLKG